MRQILAQYVEAELIHYNNNLEVMCREILWETCICKDMIVPPKQHLGGTYTVEKTRTSNVELLRVVAMCMIVISHYCVHGVLPISDNINFESFFCIAEYWAIWAWISS